MDFKTFPADVSHDMYSPLISSDSAPTNLVLKVRHARAGVIPGIPDKLDEVDFAFDDKAAR